MVSVTMPQEELVLERRMHPSLSTWSQFLQGKATLEVSEKWKITLRKELTNHKAQYSIPTLMELLASMELSKISLIDPMLPSLSMTETKEKRKELKRITMMVQVLSSPTQVTSLAQEGCPSMPQNKTL